MRTPILGGFYQSRSNVLAANRCINLYPELVETKEGKAVGALYGCPGQDLLATIGTGPIRALHSNLGDGKLYAVSGSQVYQCVASGSGLAGTLLGSIGTITGPCSIIDNGSQIAIFDGANGYLWNGAAFSTLALPFSSPVTASYQDGFGIVNSLVNDTWWQSNYRDLSTWQALNFGTADSKPDPVVALYSINREVYLLGSSGTEVWVNAGAPGFAFSRLQGVYMEIGCVAPFSVAKLGESLVWLSQDDQGQGIVVQKRGYQAQPISSHALVTAIQGYATISDAIGFAYQQGGHRFYVLTFPTANATWCWDENAGLWHQRAAFVNGNFNRHDANAYAFYGGKHVIGDWQSGNLYGWNLERYDDNGRPRKWVRSWRAMPPNKPADDPVEFDELRIDLEQGITAGAGTNPQLTLRWSDDDGQTWSNPHTANWGAPGVTANQARFRRLGQTREATGLDRIWEISSSDPVRAAIVGAVQEASPA